MRMPVCVVTVASMIGMLGLPAFADDEAAPELPAGDKQWDAKYVVRGLNSPTGDRDLPDAKISEGKLSMPYTFEIPVVIPGADSGDEIKKDTKHCKGFDHLEHRPMAKATGTFEASVASDGKVTGYVLFKKVTTNACFDNHVRQKQKDFLAALKPWTVKGTFRRDANARAVDVQAGKDRQGRLFVKQPGDSSVDDETIVLRMPGAEKQSRGPHH